MLWLASGGKGLLASRHKKTSVARQIYLGGQNWFKNLYAGVLMH